LTLMVGKTGLVEAWFGFLVIAGVCAATPVAAQKITSDSVKQVGPPLEVVKSFEDDFRLVGIGVSAKGRVFATSAGLQRPLALQHGRSRPEDRCNHALSRCGLE